MVSSQVLLIIQHVQHPLIECLHTLCVQIRSINPYVLTHSVDSVILASTYLCPYIPSFSPYITNWLEVLRMSSLSQAHTTVADIFLPPLLLPSRLRWLPSTDHSRCLCRSLIVSPD
jgi:hypothetical protein